MNTIALLERISKAMETKLGLVGNYPMSNDNFCTINPRTKERINLQPWDVTVNNNGKEITFKAATQEDFKDMITEQGNTKMPFIGERFFFMDDKPINNRLPTYENPPPPPPRDSIEGKKPNHLSDIPEEMWNENYKPELTPSFIEKYFNSESLHHALVFGSIVFGLKMIEMNWTFILGYINSIPIEAVYLMTMVFILSQTIIRAPKTNHTGFK